MSKAKWEQSRQEVASKWFAGDIVKAEKVLDALPFSTIPEWEDDRERNGSTTEGTPE